MLRILLGNTGSDIHSVANQLLELELSKSFDVLNIGVAVPKNEWIDNLRIYNPDLILIGSMNGDLGPLIEVIDLLKLSDFPMHRVVVGGNLKLGAKGLEIFELLQRIGANVIIDSDISFAEISKFCQEITSKNVQDSLNIQKIKSL